MGGIQSVFGDMDKKKKVVPDGESSCFMGGLGEVIKWMVGSLIPKFIWRGWFPDSNLRPFVLGEP